MQLILLVRVPAFQLVVGPMSTLPAEVHASMSAHPTKTMADSAETIAFRSKSGRRRLCRRMIPWDAARDALDVVLSVMDVLQRHVAKAHAVVAVHNWDYEVARGLADKTHIHKCVTRSLKHFTAEVLSKGYVFGQLLK